MRFVPEVLYGSLVLEDLKKHKLISVDEYNRMWKMFGEYHDPVIFVLIDLSQLYTDADEDIPQEVVDYLEKTENLKDFYNTKLAI
jgi:hypothetical protein